MFFKNSNTRSERLTSVAKSYLAVKFFGALYFAYPIFYGYASQVITPLQVGIFFSVIGIASFLAEIPTGIIADKYSRKVCGLLGMSMIAIAPLIIFLGHAFPAYLIAAMFYGLGRAFMNGTLDSLLYDHATMTKAAYRRVNVLEITFGQAGILSSAAIGGLLFSVYQGLPFMVEALAGCICVVLIARMDERHKEGYVRPTASHRRHFLQSIQHLLATPYLRVVVFMGVTFSVMLGMCIQFVNEAAMIEQGLQPTARGFLVSGAGVIVLAILHLFLLRVLKSDASRIIYMAVGAVVAYLAMSTGMLPVFLLGYLLWCCLNATSSFMRIIIQDQIPSSHRSTIMSSFKTLAILVGLGGSTATGLLVQSAHTPRVAYMVFALLATIVLVPCAIWLVAHLRQETTTS